MAEHEQLRAHVWVSGRVQGVFFRATTAHLARERGVAGWVRNLPDGRVEAVFEGPADAVRGLLDWCHEGPPGARVEHVEARWEPPRGESPEFRVR
jgi:acylphosphatase